MKNIILLFAFAIISTNASANRSQDPMPLTAEDIFCDGRKSANESNPCDAHNEMLKAEDVMQRWGCTKRTYNLRCSVVKSTRVNEWLYDLPLQGATIEGVERIGNTGYYSIYFKTHY